MSVPTPIPSAEPAPDALATTPTTPAMSVLDRPSVVKFRPECPPRGLLERVLGAAVLAPNHYLNQPWRFCVLAGAAREEFGEVLAERLRDKMALGGPTPPDTEAALDAERKKPLRAPVLIMVAAARTDHPKAMVVEDIAAAAAAAQNIILAAPALGLGAYWRTGDAAYDPKVKAYFGLRPDDDIIGFLYVGYPEVTRAPLARVPSHEKSEWRGWDASAGELR